MKILWVVALLLAIVGGFYYYKNLSSAPPQAQRSETEIKKSGTMKIESTVFENGGAIAPEYTCDGANTNPPLRISDVPHGTVSLALIMDDPDVPKNLRPDGLWVHWVIFNMPPDTKEIKKHTTPPGTEGANSSNKNAYQGPCPPDREHRYFFKLYALDTMLTLGAGASKSDLEQGMVGHIIEQAELVGRYNRSR